VGVATTGSNRPEMSVFFCQGTPLHTSGNPVRRASYVTGSHPPPGGANSSIGGGEVTLC